MHLRNRAKNIGKVPPLSIHLCLYIFPISGYLPVPVDCLLNVLIVWPPPKAAFMPSVRCMEHSCPEHPCARSNEVAPPHPGVSSAGSKRYSVRKWLWVLSTLCICLEAVTEAEMECPELLQGLSKALRSVPSLRLPLSSV